jgi:saccharopine dehydrogenase-like NADP-dependent oxidoreductase
LFFSRKIRSLTRNSSSEKAQALAHLSNDIEMVTCDITKSDDVKRAFKDSWAVFALTDPWGNPNQLDHEKQQGYVMADAAASLQIPYYIFSTVENVNKLSNGKL